MPTRPNKNDQGQIRMLCWSSIIPIVVVNTRPLSCHNSPALSRSAAPGGRTDQRSHVPADQDRRPPACRIACTRQLCAICSDLVDN